MIRPIGYAWTRSESGQTPDPLHWLAQRAMIRNSYYDFQKRVTWGVFVSIGEIACDEMGKADSH